MIDTVSQNKLLCFWATKDHTVSVFLHDVGDVLRGCRYLREREILKCSSLKCSRKFWDVFLPSLFVDIYAMAHLYLKIPFV